MTTLRGMVNTRKFAPVALAGLMAALALVPAAGTAHATTLTTFTARGSVNQVDVTHAPPGDALVLENAAHVSVATGTVDDLGSFLFRNVTAGDGYTVVDGNQVSTPLHVATTSEIPPQSLYTSQHLVSGFQYITTRDGTRLSAEVTLPGPANAGPYPTVIEYSGYDPSHPGAPQPSTQIAQLLGYATVGVNIRGTGCSGGAFDFFEPLQTLDGYDVVETVAAEPWVLDGKPGMVGISYPGIAQTFVAPTRPPHLAAIAALSVVADTYRSLADPGGIPNVGFPRDWAQERDNAARPYGQGWEQSVVNAGGPNGAQCAENQLLRHENMSLVGEFDSHMYREPVDQANAITPALLAPKIDVPVFMGGAWQDEQTGGQESLIWPNLTGVPKGDLKLFGTNGTHVDSLVAEFDRWYEFLEFYVAHRVPHLTALERGSRRGVPGRDRNPRHPTAAGPLRQHPELRVATRQVSGRTPGANPVRERRRRPEQPRRAARRLLDQLPVVAAARRQADRLVLRARPEARLEAAPDTRLCGKRVHVVRVRPDGEAGDRLQRQYL